MLRHLFSVVAIGSLLAACSSNSTSVESMSYTLSGTLAHDSIITDSVLTLIVDSHDAVQQITLPVVHGSFAYQGVTSGIDELYLSDSHRRTVRLYALGGSDIQVDWKTDGKIILSESDSLNLWLEGHTRYMKGLEDQMLCRYLDSICQQHSTAVQSGLLLRDNLYKLNDSLFVRRTLGKLSDQAKPTWLLQSIDEQLDAFSSRISRNFRLPRLTVGYANDSTYELLKSRQESLLIFFWADYDSSAVDSLQLFRSIARDYGLYQWAENFYKDKSATRSSVPHRIELFSVCLHAADSASWRAAVEGIPGKHCLLEAGYAHPLPTACQVRQLPYNMLFDRFGNFQKDHLWGTELRAQLERTPQNSTIKKSSSSK